MSSEPQFRCPRCLGQIPNNDQPGAYMGAGSRMTDDRSIEICSACGQDEAMGEHFGPDGGQGLVPPAAWPIVTSTSPVT